VVPVQWFQFESALELGYAPGERTALEVQLYSNMPTGKVFYFDDIFVDVAEPTFDDADLYWPYVQTHWEFNTAGDTEGWWNFDPNRISFFDVNDGALLLDGRYRRPDEVCSHQRGRPGQARARSLLVPGRRRPRLQGIHGARSG